MKKINEICDILNGYAFKSKHYVDSGIRVIRIANVQDGYISDENPCFYPNSSIDDIEKYILKENDLLISLTGNVGRVALLNKEYLPAALNQRVACLRIKESYVDKKYLFYYLNQRKFIDDCIKASKGVAQLNLSTKWLESYQLDIPPIKEQERIVAKIEELFSDLDNAVETLNDTKTQLEVYRQAVYASIYDHNNVRPITDFFEVTGGLTKNSKRNTLPKKMPYLRVANVYFNMLDLSEIKEIGVNEQEIEKCLLKKNDLLFVEGNGSKSQIGRVAIWDGSIENCLHQNHLIKARPLGNMIPAYALFYLISGGGRKQINEVSKSTSGLYTLSTNKVRELMIPYCDYEKQQQGVDEIESRLSVCKSIEETVDTALQQATAMRQSILKQAFEGRLL